MIWRLLIFELILVIVVAGVWLLAPLVGIKSVLWRIVIILALILPPIILVIWKLLSERKAASGLENAIKDQGRAHQDSVRPDRREEIEVLNDAFAQAVASLKRSKLAGGRKALYAFPWYMIIGPPAVGKSTALLRSGLRFPFTPGDRKAIKGVGGTRNCDWWFSEQAILLDTAGRYTSEDDDLEEWIAFLRMAKKYRRKRPLNGLIVAVAVSELLTAKPDELEELAAQIRSRIDQVINELDLALPIYLLFTKCDLINGFVEFFGDLKKSTRTQILGFTVPLTDQSTHIESLFNDEFRLLLSRLQQRALRRLAGAKSVQRAEVFQFPLQFAAAQEPLATFASMLLTPNPYQESPRLRGVYFCSGTQEGRPVDRVMAMMSRALGLKELSAGGFKERPTKKSYFLRDVFTEVIFPDKDIAGTTATGRKRRRLIGIAGLALALLVSATAIGLSAVTFGNNRSMVKTTTELAKNSRITTPEDPRKVTDSLKALDELGGWVDKLSHYHKEGPPWTLGLGFYRGNAVHADSQKVFIKRMRQAFVMPAGSELEATLIDIANSSDDTAKGASKDFDLLKTYLMATDAKRLEVEFASNVLVGQWKKRLHPDVSQKHELLKRNAVRYMKLVKARKAKWLERDNNVVRNVRHALRARDAEYRRIIGAGEKMFRPFSIRDALRGRVQTVIKSKHTVPGIYTRRGWSEYMRKRIAKQMASGSKLEPWVLGEEGTKDVASRLRNRYFDQYVAAWLKFLKGLSIDQPSSAKDAQRTLEKLTENPPLFKDLFEAIAHNTDLPLMDASGLKNASKMIRGKAGKLLNKAKRLGLDKTAGKAFRKRAVVGRVNRAFLPLRELVKPPKGIDGRAQMSGIQQYQDQLGIVRDNLSDDLKGTAEPGKLDKSLEEARRVTKGILASLPGSLRRLVSALFYTPLETTAGTAKVAAANRAGEALAIGPCAAFKEKLAGRYPFASSKRDALMQDVTEFFGSSGTVWSHYEKSLKHQLPRRGDKFTPAPDQKVPKQIVGFINRAWRVTRSLFPLGSDVPRLRFEVRPRPAILASGASYQISEIILEVDGKSKTYRNGPVEQWTFTWTGGGKRSRLLVRGAGGLREQFVYHGDWSLMRVLDHAKVKKRGSWYRAVWSLKSGQIKITMDFRPSRTHNPLFRRLRINCK